MNPTLAKQLALDYCCTEDDVRDNANHFTVYEPLPCRRRFEETSEDCFLKITVVNNKLLVTGREDIVSVLQMKIGRFRGTWFMDAPALASVDRLIVPYGWQIEQVHPFYIGKQTAKVDLNGYDLRWYEQKDIRKFENDERFEEAFCFDENAPDVLGVAALRAGEIVAMAGASADSDLMWQLGVNTMPEYRNRGIGSKLVEALKNEVIKRGVLPFYGTAMSHHASMRLAQNAGFYPAWTEMITSEIE